jgi:hypothetical protein
MEAVKELARKQKHHAKAQSRKAANKLAKSFALDIP